MKNILFLLMLIMAKSSLLSQNNQGFVTYQMIDIDTINNKITIQDSVYANFAFKPNKTKWEMGFVNRPIMTKTILNQEDFYLIINEVDTKTAIHGELSNQNNFNQVLNYTDTSLLITKTTITKTIAGRLCKKLILKFKIPNSPTMVLWYDETIECKSIIPGAGSNGKSIKGVIMEYETPSPLGKMIVTAKNISFGNIANSQFNPNLSGYQITELERENGEHCNGHH